MSEKELIDDIARHYDDPEVSACVRATLLRFHEATRPTPKVPTDEREIRKIVEHTVKEMVEPPPYTGYDTVVRTNVERCLATYRQEKGEEEEETDFWLRDAIKEGIKRYEASNNPDDDPYMFIAKAVRDAMQYEMKNTYLAGAKAAWTFLFYPENKPKEHDGCWLVKFLDGRSMDVTTIYHQETWRVMGVTAFLPIPKEE